MTDSKIEIVRYIPEMKELWDRMVKGSKNGTFLFLRDYMDYHSDIFKDCSFIFFRKGKPYCIIPGCEIGSEYSSYAGLTYGGLIMSDECTTEGILNVFEILLRTLHNAGFRSLVYKPIPHIYHRLPAEEDLYALFRYGARLSARNISSTILFDHPLHWKKDRLTAIQRGEKSGIEVKESNDFTVFWDILEYNLLSKYNTLPVHDRIQISRLASLFPDNIKLYTAYHKDEMSAGIVCYISDMVVHTQYISAYMKGKKMGAVDCIVSYLMNKFSEKKYLDFGTSNLDGGKYLNESLIYQKEGFGGRGVCYDTYHLAL